MSLNIKNERVHLLAREAASRTGKSQTKVVEDALELLIGQLDQASDTRWERARELLDDFDARMTPEDRRRLTTEESVRRERSAGVIVDTSAVVAVLKDEPERQVLLDALQRDETCRMSAASYLETAIVVDGLGDPVKSRRLDELLMTWGVEIVDVTVAQTGLARRAYRDYGKGSGHPAGLNIGDVFAYALAADTGEPLLFKGDDFAHTDIRAAI